MGDGGDDDYLGDLSQFLPPHEIATPQAKEKENVSKGYKRKLNWKEKREMKKKEQQKEEDEQIKRGYSSAIPSTNIGFKMLQQMGYNPGVALGKHGQGLLEPISLEIKRSRTGLGRDSVKKEKQIQKAKEMERIVQKNKMKEANMMSEYGERKKLLWQSSKIVENYKKARTALSQLEEAKYGHPRDVLKEEEPEEDSEETVKEEDEEEEEVTKEDLQAILNTLKTEFHYCFYCGCQYESEEAMVSSCPGTEEEDH